MATAKLHSWACLALLFSACALTGSTEVHGSNAAGYPEANVASVPTLGSTLWGIDEDKLTSRASMVQMTAEQTCFDLLIRRPIFAESDRRDLSLRITAEVDQRPVATDEVALSGCGLEGRCLPPESVLQGFVPELDERVRVEGRRICFQSLPLAQREVVLAANPGRAAWRFRFALSRRPDLPPIATVPPGGRSPGR